MFCASSPTTRRTTSAFTGPASRGCRASPASSRRWRSGRSRAGRVIRWGEGGPDSQVAADSMQDAAELNQSHKVFVLRGFFKSLVAIEMRNDGVERAERILLRAVLELGAESAIGLFRPLVG